MKFPQPQNKLRRRAFLAGAAAATTFTIVKPSLVRGSAANSAIALGMIGCGGRGNWIAKLFPANANYRWVACADYFQDRVDAFGSKNDIPADRRYTTLSCHKKLLESPLDAVVIESPPYFHPQHAAAAVEAGKHVFIAKPIAIDAPGCLSIAESGKKATAKNLVFLVDFQTRANDLYREAARRVHAGDIGRIVCAESHYPWAGGAGGMDGKTPEERMRYWHTLLEFCGDVIVEQDIHALDVATWFLNADPVRALGTGGRTLRKVGNTWDHFSIIYWFPNNVLLTHSSIKMIPGCKDEIRCRVFGSDGMVGSDYYTEVWIRGKKPYEGGSVGNLYTTGAENNIVEFHRCITKGDYTNPTVAPSVRSNLTAVLGRTAAYSGKMVSWEEMLKAGEKLEPDLKGLKQ